MSRNIGKKIFREQLQKQALGISWNNDTMSRNIGKKGLCSKGISESLGNGEILLTLPESVASLGSIRSLELRTTILKRPLQVELATCDLLNYLGVFMNSSLCAFSPLPVSHTPPSGPDRLKTLLIFA